ncbi:MAG: cupin domain-containing protein [candidate division Zixibacteria bacterium]|nr:cupin domain-containing protein [candidate division Zixibacteria bacterium]
MFIRALKDCAEFIAGDKTILRELFHPDKDGLNVYYSLAHATVKPRQASIPHKLKSTEVYHILQGEGIMHIDEEEQKVNAGDVIYIPPNGVQFIENTGETDLAFLCIVEPAWRPEDEDVL